MVADAEESGNPDHCGLRPPNVMINSRNSICKRWPASEPEAKRRNSGPLYGTLESERNPAHYLKLEY